MDDPDAAAGIFARYSPYLDRYVQIGVASDRVISVTFPTDPDAGASEEHELLDRVFAYLNGVEEDDFTDVQVALTVPTDYRTVLEAVRDVPYGDQVSCEAIARMTPNLDSTDDDDLIAVRTALSENPAPIFIPDHRVRDGASSAPAPVEQKLRSLEGL